MKLLIDNCLSPRIARSLNALFDDHNIFALRDAFRENTPDVEWITKLSGQGGCAVLTKDLRIRTRPHERAALDRSRIIYFFLAAGWHKFGVEETAARLIRLIPKMALQCEIADPTVAVSSYRSTPAPSCDPTAIDRRDRRGPE